MAMFLTGVIITMLPDLQWLTEHREALAIIQQSKMLDTRNGSVTLHFDNLNNIRKIELNQLLFKH